VCVCVCVCERERERERKRERNVQFIRLGRPRAPGPLEKDLEVLDLQKKAQAYGPGAAHAPRSYIFNFYKGRMTGHPPLISLEKELWTTRHVPFPDSDDLWSLKNQTSLFHTNKNSFSTIF